eukprot:GHVL01018403.1.p1 GENE.GHVL01018403.1~~GHVL01018403.1.p1  ORF type:complete len:580 (+),score=98.35 GHVL01018403.1:13-1752(+)
MVKDKKMSHTLEEINQKNLSLSIENVRLQNQVDLFFRPPKEASQIHCLFDMMVHEFMPILRDLAEPNPPAESQFIKEDENIKNLINVDLTEITQKQRDVFHRSPTLGDQIEYATMGGCASLPSENEDALNAILDTIRSKSDKKCFEKESNYVKQLSEVLREAVVYTNQFEDDRLFGKEQEEIIALQDEMQRISQIIKNNPTAASKDLATWDYDLLEKALLMQKAQQKLIVKIIEGIKAASNHKSLTIKDKIFCEMEGLLSESLEEEQKCVASYNSCLKKENDLQDILSEQERLAKDSRKGFQVLHTTREQECQQINKQIRGLLMKLESVMEEDKEHEATVLHEEQKLKDMQEVVSNKRLELENYKNMSENMKTRWQSGTELLENIKNYCDKLLTSLEARAQEKILNQHNKLYLKRELADSFHAVFDSRARTLSTKFESAAQTLLTYTQTANEQADALSLSGSEENAAAMIARVTDIKEHYKSLCFKVEDVKSLTSELQEMKNLIIELITSVKATSAPSKEEEEKIQQYIKELVPLSEHNSYPINNNKSENDIVEDPISEDEAQLVEEDISASTADWSKI